MRNALTLVSMLGFIAVPPLVPPPPVPPASPPPAVRSTPAASAARGSEPRCAKGAHPTTAPAAARAHRTSA